jgi:ABC-type branched-subunit amino acid transport system substrate-binding protein
MKFQRQRRKFIKAAGSIGIAGTAGCLGTLGGGGGGGTFKIGVVGPMSGQGSVTGENMVNGIELGIKEVGGEILGREVEFYEGDTEFDASAAARSTQNLISQEDIDLVHGPFLSNTALAMMDVTAEEGVPMLINQAVSSEISDKIKEDPDKYSMVYKNGPHPNSYGHGWQQWANYVQSEGIYEDLGDSPSIAMIAENTSYGRSTMDTLEQYLTEIDWQVATKEIVELEQTDFSNVLSKVQSTDPDVVWAVQSSPSPGASLVKNFLNTDMSAHFWHNYIPAQPDYIKILGDKADGVVWMTNINLVSPNADDFIQKYSDEYGTSPSPTAGIAYDTVRMIQKAAEEADSLEAEKLMEVYPTLNFEGTIGVYDYKDDRNETKHGADAVPGIVRQFWDKKNVDLFPNEFATGEWKAPPWK